MLDSGYWLAAARQSPMPELGWAGVLPFTWTQDTPRSFERFSQGGAPLVAPIIQIILSRAPAASSAWVEQHGYLVITPLAVPQLLFAPCASSARAWAALGSLVRPE